ncbi:MAG: ABC transporter substrate-binding protein [Clostridiales bacterium]|nr:ABC transporter substrate-binding protein [Clostridiales bacterium]
MKNNLRLQGLVLGLVLLLASMGFLLIKYNKSASAWYDDTISNLMGDQAPKTLIVGRTLDSIGLDPAVVTDSESFQVTTNIYEGLVKFDTTGSEVLPSLAESWKMSEDGKTWVFKIRDNIKFHDGSKLNAEAVSFNFHRWMDIDSPYHAGHFSYWSYSFGGFPGIVKSVTALSDYSLEIVLNEPYAPFLSVLSMPSFGIASPEAIMKYNENLKLSPVGTGPFMFESWEKNIQITLEKNKDYWGTKAKVDQVVFKKISSQISKIDLLLDGEVHIVDGLNPSEVDQSRTDKRLKLYYRPYFNISYMALNHNIEPFDNLKVRQAISLLIDKNEMINDDPNPLTRPANTFLPPVLLGYHESIKSPEPDVNAAKRLLSEAGYPDGFTTSLWVMDQPRGYISNPVQVAKFLQSELSKASITVDLHIIKWDTFIEAIKEGDHPMAIVGWNGDIVDPDNFLYTFFSSENTKSGLALNYSFYENPTVDRLLEQARNVTDVEFRKSLYREIQEIIASEVVSIPLTHTMTAIGSSNLVKGFEPHITGKEVLNQIELIDETDKDGK